MMEIKEYGIIAEEPGEIRGGEGESRRPGPVKNEIPLTEKET